MAWAKFTWLSWPVFGESSKEFSCLKEKEEFLY